MTEERDALLAEIDGPRRSRAGRTRKRRRRRSTAVDAIVMASAAARGDVVFTDDPDDLERLRAFFPTVRVVGCGGD
ncbi:MAG: hypothetical protein JST00_19230 [Deltaproteobacteria bacterium]|nr:hypothetical protein [Deltaproteobacteria bacterium]